MAPTPKAVRQIFEDYAARRNAIIRALTYEVDEFVRLCDPDKDNLSLYGYPNGTWEVCLPPMEVPTWIPEPVLGINFSTDVLGRKEWLYWIAAHSDSWLISVAFSLGARARLTRYQRCDLFSRINNLPTVREVVIERNSIEDKPSKDSASGSKSQGSTKRSIDGGVKINPMLVDDSNKYAEDEEIENICGSCGEKDNVDEFWIACDFCQRWFHGLCVKVTPSIADSIHQYKCPSCMKGKAVIDRDYKMTRRRLKF